MPILESLPTKNSTVSKDKMHKYANIRFKYANLCTKETNIFTEISA